MTALHHLGHANEGTSIMALEAHLNYQSPGNLYSELMRVFLEFVSKCVFEIAEGCELSTLELQREGVHGSGFSVRAVSETSAAGDQFSRCRCLSKILKIESSTDRSSRNPSVLGWCKPEPCLHPLGFSSLGCLQVSVLKFLSFPAEVTAGAVTALQIPGEEGVCDLAVPSSPAAPPERGQTTLVRVPAGWGPGWAGGECRMSWAVTLPWAAQLCFCCVHCTQSLWLPALLRAVNTGSSLSWEVMAGADPLVSVC